MLVGLKDYYGRRAPEYEQIYHRDDPDRQWEQAEVAEAINVILGGRRVLEIACGTGFWTEVAASVAKHVVAIDASADLLALARQKGLPPDKVEFHQADAYDLEAIAGDFDAGLACFWFSHVPKARIADFLKSFHRRVGSGGIVFMADNMFVPGVGAELLTRPASDDTFKLRQLADGSTYEVLKNYYDADQLRAFLEPRSTGLCMNGGSCFWWLSYTVGPEVITNGPSGHVERMPQSNFSIRGQMNEGERRVRPTTGRRHGGLNDHRGPSNTPTVHSRDGALAL